MCISLGFVLFFSCISCCYESICFPPKSDWTALTAKSALKLHGIHFCHFINLLMYLYIRLFWGREMILFPKARECNVSMVGEAGLLTTWLCGFASAN